MARVEQALIFRYHRTKHSGVRFLFLSMVSFLFPQHHCVIAGSAVRRMPKHALRFEIPWSLSAVEGLISLIPLISLSQHTTYFKAYGTDPTWNLEISEDSIFFHSDVADCRYVAMKHMPPVKHSGIKQYQLSTADASVHIEIAQMPCEHPGTNERFLYSVHIDIKRNKDAAVTSFQGCGLYVPDARLQHQWQLHSIRGNPVTKENFDATMPYIIVDAAGSWVKGYGGCNTFNGRVHYEKDLLRFTDIFPGKIACDPANQEKLFMESLQFTTQYQFAADTLILSYPGREMLRLIKK